jgi:hypothetical protein
VGYRIRERDRNTGVVFKFRRCGAGAFGDATPATAVVTFNGTDPSGETITLEDYAGTSHVFYFGPGGGGGNIEVPLPVGGTMDASGWAQQLTAQITALNPGFRVYATQDGATVNLAMDAARPEINTATAYGARPIAYSSTGWLSSSPANFRTETIVDGAGRYMGPASAGGTNVQYLYDTVSGVEVWFWHRYNQWRQRVGYSGTVTPNSDDAWGQWYGVVRDEAGLCLWYIQYMPLEGAVDEHYRYGTVGMDGRDSAALVNSGNKGLWNYDEVTSETLGQKITDTSSAYYDQRGWNFAGDIGNPIEYPTWIAAGTNKPDPFPAGGGLYQDGSREGTNTLNHVRDNQRGALWHSWWFETQDAQFVPMGPPPDYWPSLGNYWTPRGYAITTDPRAEDVILVTP